MQKRNPWTATRTAGLTFMLAAGIACAGPGAQAGPGAADERGAAKAAPPEKAAASGVRRTLSFGGKERFYEVHVPAQYRKGTPAAVVLVWHGGGGFPDAVATQSHMNEVSDRHGFLAVYPAGSGMFAEKLLTFNAGGCCAYAVKNKIDDIGFTSALLDDLAKGWSIDPKRVYSTGISNGAMMSYRLACELPDRIAAIGPVSGVLGVPCDKPGRPVSVIHFHGTADQNSPYGGGKGKHSVSQVDFPSAPDTVKFWVKRNGCPEKAVAAKKTKGAATETLYGPCKDGTEVAFWSIDGGGHAWPGGDWASKLEGRIVGPVNRDIFASELMWEFFDRHPIK